MTPFAFFVAKEYSTDLYASDRKLYDALKINPHPAIRNYSRMWELVFLQKGT
jgi:hypothetical protein